MADGAVMTEPDPPETVVVDGPVAACDGGDGPLGHPRVFLRLVDGRAVCPYCSRNYVFREGAGHDRGH